jgi:adenylosuccinate lyase
MARDAAYRSVQSHALAAAAGGPDLPARLRGDPQIAGLLGPELERCFDLAPYLAHVDELFERGLAAAGATGAAGAAAKAASRP